MERLRGKIGKTSVSVAVRVSNQGPSENETGILTITLLHSGEFVRDNRSFRITLFLFVNKDRKL